MGDEHHDRGDPVVRSIEDLTDSVVRSTRKPIRRSVLRYLTATGAVGLDRLALVVTGLSTYGNGVQVATAADYRRTRTELHHLHLPQLEQAGLVEYDTDTHLVTAGAIPDGLVDLLDEFDELETSRRSPSTTDDGRAPGDCRLPPFGVDTGLRSPVTSLRDPVTTVERARVTVRLFTPESHDDALAAFLNRNVRIEHEPLPTSLSPGFAVVERDDGLALCRLDVLTSVDPPPTGAPWEGETDRTAYRQLLAVFREAPFATTDRTQLLATSREIEDRAWRVGRGQLHAGFQSLSVFRTQSGLYRRLAEETDLDVRVYGRPDWTPPRVDGLTAIATEDDEIGEFWFVVYRDPERRNSSALLAQERSTDEYYGFWKYDAGAVERFATYLETSYSSAEG